jgi:hypothetical protein
MKRILAVLALLLLSAGHALGQYVSVSGYVQQGGKAVTVGGLPPTTTKWMQTFPGATVTVYATGTTNPAPIFSTATGSVKANPFTSYSDTSFWQFFVLPGTYDLRFSGTGISSPWTITVPVRSTGLGNGTTVIDLTTIPNWTTIASTDLAQLYVDGALLCAPYSTCILNGWTLPGSAYPWTTWDITQPLTALLPSSILTKNVDNYRPAFILENLSNMLGSLGEVTIQGMGQLETFIKNNTPNDTIINRSTNTYTKLTVRDLAIQGPDAAVGGCGFSTAIDADGGMPNQHNPQLNASNLLLFYSRFGIREDTSYTDVWENIRSGNCTGMDIEGGNGVVNQWYGDDSRAGGVSSAYWQGSQFVAGVPYFANQLVMPRDTVTGHIYIVTAPGTSGTTPPTWPTGTGATVTSGGVTFQEAGHECYEWWTNHAYPAGSCVQDYPLGGGHIFKTTAGGTSGVLTPTWTYVGGTVSDVIFNTTPTAGGINYVQGDVGAFLVLACGAKVQIQQVNNGSGSGGVTQIGAYPVPGFTGASCAAGAGQSTTGGTGTGSTVNISSVVNWVDQAYAAQNTYGSDPAGWTLTNPLFEEALHGDGFDMINGGVNFNGAILSFFTNWGLFCGPNENNQNTGCTGMTWTGGQIQANLPVSAGGINLGESFNVNFTNITVNGYYGSGNNTGIGILALCAANGSANRNFIGVNVEYWNTLTSYATGCSNPGFNVMEPTGGYTTDGQISTKDLIVRGTGTFSGLSDTTNCSSAGGTCTSATAGAVTIASGGAKSVVVNTTAVTAKSDISLAFDASMGTRLSVTCNTNFQQPYVSARVPGTSFTISTAAAFTTNPGCISWSLRN